MEPCEKCGSKRVKPLVYGSNVWIECQDCLHVKYLPGEEKK